MWRTIILYTIIDLIIAENATFQNYKVFRITPTTNAHIELLRQLDENPNEFNFWRAPTYINMHVDLMISPHKLPEFHELMTQIEAPYQIYVEDVQKLIDQTRIKRTANYSFDFISYHTLEEIYDNLNKLAKQYPDKVKIIVGGNTFEKRQIKGVKVIFKANNPGIFIEGGIYAREWISSTTVMYILHQLLTSNDQDVRTLAERHNWYIFPVFNPDGYVYTYTTNRMWRKTRELHGLFCRGSDPNRNWDYNWNSKGSPCSETYPGSAPFSEIETKSMSEYIRSISNELYAYISFHGYSQLLHPYGHMYDRNKNDDDMYTISLKSIAALKKKYGTEYQFVEIDHTDMICGSSVNYIKNTYNKPIVYIHGLRDKGYGFLLPPEQIIPTGEEILDSLIVMFKEAKALGYPKKCKVIKNIKKVENNSTMWIKYYKCSNKTFFN